MRGEQLYGLVKTYAGFGWHRTGTTVDAETAAWFADQLTSRGLATEIESVPFDRWVSTSTLHVAGEEVEHLALLTPWTGSVNTSNVNVQDFNPRSGGFPTLVNEPLSLAIASGATAAVFCTTHPEGSLVGVNREPDIPGTPAFPAVLVAGERLQACVEGPIRLFFEAKIDPSATTSNVIGRRGSGTPVVLTTPLTGWFGCAGERGTGIAVLLDLIDRLVDVPLLVVGTGGHELGCFGAHRLVENGNIDARAVVHLGASIAVEEPNPDGGRRLASTRVAMTTLNNDNAEPVAAALQNARLNLTPSATSWLGEGNAWKHLHLPMLSITGAGLDFHTPQDTPERVTSPVALETAADAIGSAVEMFLARTPSK